MVEEVSMTPNQTDEDGAMTPNTRTITKKELETNKPYGWYADKHGSVYQVVTISPRKVRLVGHLISNTKPTNKEKP